MVSEHVGGVRAGSEFGVDFGRGFVGDGVVDDVEVMKELILTPRVQQVVEILLPTRPIQHKGLTPERMMFPILDIRLLPLIKLLQIIRYKVVVDVLPEM